MSPPLTTEVLLSRGRAFVRFYGTSHRRPIGEVIMTEEQYRYLAAALGDAAERWETEHECPGCGGAGVISVNVGPHVVTADCECRGAR